jgi:Domain of unknown function (DUF4838)/Carbohydrate family 9 binding domain-like
MLQEKRNMKSLLCCLMFIAIMLLWQGNVEAKGFVVKDGKAEAEIIIAEKPTRMQKLAAEELQFFIQKISGAKLKISSSPGDENLVNIYVGKSRYTDALKYSTKGLKYDAYRMISSNDYLVLLGNDENASMKGPGDNIYKRNTKSSKEATKKWDKLVGHSRWVCPGLSRFKTYNKKLKVRYDDQRGSLMAVYDFLRSLGARWYFPGEFGEVLPKMKTIALPEVAKTVHPDSPMRHITGSAYKFGKTGRRHTLWMMRMGLGGLPVSGVHGIDKIIHRDQTRKEHPERYVLTRGKRDIKSRGGKPCLSSKGLLEDNIKYLRILFDVYGKKSASVMPTDGFVQCQCAKCKGKFTPELGSRGVQSNLVWEYVNNVAKELYKTHPDRRIVCAAYSSFSVPPTNIKKFSPNVYVMLNNGRMDFVDPELRDLSLSRRNEWLKKVASKRPFSTHDNYTVLGSSPVPLYRPRLIAKDIRSLKDICLGEFVEENSMHPAELRENQPPPLKLAINHLNIYVTARLWWNADQDIDALLNEYYQKFYGPAAKEMKNFIEYCEANTRTMVKNKEQIKKALDLFALAEKKVDKNSIYGKRIALIAKSLAATKNVLRQLSVVRAKVRRIKPGRLDKDKDITIDGNLDERNWKRIKRVNQLVNTVYKKQKPKIMTSFKTLMTKSNLYIAVICETEAGEKTKSSKKKKDDPEIWKGEYVDILIETDKHAYYQISISPNGEIADLKINGKKQYFRWDSLAEYAIKKNKNQWILEIKIPFITNNDDPNHKLDGRYPHGDRAPWYINIARQRIKDNKRLLCSITCTGKDSFHVIENFAPLFTGKSMAERAARLKAKSDREKRKKEKK